jgi:hypothetical protein
MSTANLKIIEELKSFIFIVSSSYELTSLFSTKENSFSRNRKLNFERLVFLIIKLCKKTLSAELDQFFSEIDQSMTCSVSAFCQQRMKLNPLIFSLWNEVLCKSFYLYKQSEVKRWRGFLLVAGDGSNVSLVKTPDLENYFGGQTNNSTSFVQGKTFYFYDILNKLILFAKITPYRVGELTIAYTFIDKLKNDMLMIYDRNFFNYKMIALHCFQEREIKFVIRANENHKVIDEFVKSDKKSDIIWLKPTSDMQKGMKQSGFIVDSNTKIKVRLIRVELPTCVEVLATNLWEEDGYEIEEFKELYNKRWGIETNISLQKNILKLESFSGLRKETIEQDFYATVFTANLLSVLVKDAQEELDKKVEKYKYKRQVNGNKAFGIIREHIVSLFLTNDPERILKKLMAYFIRDALPVRPDRTFPRVVKNRLSKTRHKTYTNYKPSF